MYNSSPQHPPAPHASSKRGEPHHDGVLDGHCALSSCTSRGRRRASASGQPVLEVGNSVHGDHALEDLLAVAHENEAVGQRLGADHLVDLVLELGPDGLEELVDAHALSHAMAGLLSPPRFTANTQSELVPGTSRVCLVEHHKLPERVTRLDAG